MTIKSVIAVLAGLGLAMVLVPLTASASGSGTGIVGSPHDFTDNVFSTEGVLVAGSNIENDNSNAAAFNNKRKEICRVCHVPHDHGAVRYGNQGILWNHALSTKTSWSMYASDATMLDFIDGTIEAAPAGTSKLCLGCHDGVSAVNQYDGKAPADTGYGGGTTYTADMWEGSFAIGNTTASLQNNHPISITYAFGTDPQLKATTSTFASGDSIADVLVNSRVECSTCHDVHDKEAVAGTHLLRSGTKGADLTGAGASALCLVCHDK